MPTTSTFRRRILLWVLPAVIVAGASLALLYRPRDAAYGNAVAVAAAPRHRATNTLFLAGPTQLSGTEPNLFVPTLIMRELPRQALLIAARDQLGLYTRDGALREPAPQHDAADSSLRFDVRFLQGTTIPITIAEDGPKGRPIFNQDLPVAGTFDDMNMLKLIEDSEVFSRGKYVEVLRQAGFEPVARPTSRPANPDLSLAERQLDELTEVSQFAAIRAAHAAMFTPGRSAPAALGVLARGYANLSQLSRAQWSIAADVFGARSLLYAQRMVADDPHSALAHWHRAYALALFGLHRDALADVVEARKLAADSRPPAAPPPWANLIEPLCRYQAGKLLDAAAGKDSQAPLAMFFCFLTVENCGSDAACIEFAKEALELNPKCVRLIDAICDKAGVSYLHAATEMGPAMHQAVLAGELHALEPLPRGIGEAVQSLQNKGPAPGLVAAVDASLVSEPADIEPSWALLGRALQEIDFLQVRRRAQFMAQIWGVDASEFVHQAMPLVAQHPYRALIEAYGLYSAGAADPTRLGQTLKDLDLIDPRINVGAAVQLTKGMETADKLRGDQAWMRAFQDMDRSAYDIEPSLGIGHPEYFRGAERNLLLHANHLRTVSPYSPVAEAVLIQLDWGHSKDLADEWSAQHPNHPALNAALARKYSELHQYDKAEPYWRAYLRVAPDAAAYRQLAEGYLQSGKEDMWLATLQESLKQEDYGLEHSITNEQIARHYMKAAAFAKARPYADAAAESGSGASMVCAAECYEGLKQWDMAEHHMREFAERYERPIDWLIWCKRTGHGNSAAAIAASRDYIKRLESRTDPSALDLKLQFFLLANDRVGAVDPLQRTFDSTGDPWSAVNLAMILLEQGKTDAARALLQNAAVRGLEFRFSGTKDGLPAMAAVARFMASSLQSNDPAGLPLDEIKATVANVPQYQQIDIWYVVGEFLKIRGHNQDAAACFKRSAYTNDAGRIDAILAIQELRMTGELPAAY